MSLKMPSVPNKRKNLFDAKVFAQQLNEIGILSGNISSDKVTGWSFIFPLENFRNKKFTEQVKKVSKCPLFGRVVSCSHQTKSPADHQLECVTKLSSTKETERSGYKITLESQ
jgi:hypothetical protein